MIYLQTWTEPNFFFTIYLLLIFFYIYIMGSKINSKQRQCEDFSALLHGIMAEMQNTVTCYYKCNKLKCNLNLTCTPNVWGHPMAALGPLTSHTSKTKAIAGNRVSHLWLITLFQHLKNLNQNMTNICNFSICYNLKTFNHLSYVSIMV